MTEITSIEARGIIGHRMVERCLGSNLLGSSDAS